MTRTAHPSRRTFLSSAAAFAAAAHSRALPSEHAVPSTRQLAWSKLEFYNFLHFSINTFTGKEWGYGDEDPRLFNPTAFDAGAIVEALKVSGSKGVILTCKHHDGFCLWPTKTTEHSIRHSPFQNGRGDIVRDLSRAAARAGLKFGVYLSPWDRNQATYGTPQYIDLYRRQLRELLTDYGPVFEIWHDGANGGDGYYGGAREKRLIDKLHYYHWPDTWALERELQPEANLFSDVGPDIRWVGNEKGVAGMSPRGGREAKIQDGSPRGGREAKIQDGPCWATYTPRAPGGGPGSPGNFVEAEATSGTRDGKYWMPAECDVSIRPGWFWHDSENGRVKTPRELFDLYLASVGRGASLLLNVPPDRRGLIHETDAASLRGFGTILSSTLEQDLAAGASVAINGFTTVLNLPHPVRFDLIRLREDIRFGQWVYSFEVSIWQANEWRPAAAGTSVGICRLLKLPAPVTTDQVLVRILTASGLTSFSEISLHLTSD